MVNRATSFVSRKTSLLPSGPVLLPQEFIVSDCHALSRLRWACRRGMLELDVLLAPFAEQDYPGLAPAQQQAFQQLLQHSDLELFRWLLRREQPAAPALQQIIGVILERHEARHAV